MIYVWPLDIVLTFFCGVAAGVLLTEGIFKPRREKRALIRRRLMGCYGLREI